ncbi:MAG: metallophosphoesterase [Chloroherpetonaceae bacterium]|nr:metallophosphoesterase [Chthonomonadaceae bacterium]MDW8206538.1 metallophosphoesterase [Chloroherpetonaceae bacterium]
MAIIFSEMNVHTPPGTATHPALSRRQFLVRTLALFGADLLGTAISERQRIATTFHRIPLRALRQPVRLVQLSDLHRSWCVPEGFIAHVVRRANALRPDVVLLTGDFVTHSAHYAESCAAQLAHLRAPLGCYACLGNHDHDCSRQRGCPAVTRALAEAGVRMLTNRNLRLDPRLWIVGIDDCFTGHPDPEAAFRNIPATEPVIAMTHNPIYYHVLRNFPCLTLAGHTHGGQINLPIITSVFMQARQFGRSVQLYKQGWFHEPGYPGRMYVSRGLGVVGIPLRFRATPEIAVFDLIPA